MAARAESLTLSRVGFNAVKEAERIIKTAASSPRAALLELRENLVGFEREQLQGELATYYPYFILNFQGRRRIFSAPNPHPDFLVENQIEPQERGGATLNGWRSLEEGLTTEVREGSISDRSSKTFLWISPRGRAGEEGEYQNINYSHHQIYLGIAEGGKIGTWALKCDVEEKFLKSWIEGLSASSISIEGMLPSLFVNSPLVLPAELGISPKVMLLKLKEIITSGGCEDTFCIHKKETTVYKIGIEEVLRSMEEAKNARGSATIEGIIGALTSEFSEGKISQGQVAEKVTSAYFSLMRQYEDAQGNVLLQGCGGTINLNLNEFGLKTTFSPKSLNPFSSTFSTAFRIGEATNSNSLENQKKLKCECPFCHKKIEAVIENGKIHCPACGASAPYKC